MSDDFKSLVVSAESKLREVAPQWLSVERLTRLALAARSRNPGLMECTAESFLLFCMRCAETGLEPIGAGGAWPVPFRNKNGTKEVIFIPDWRGLISLAKRSEQIKHAYGDVIHEGDEWDYQKGDDPRLMHKPALTNRGKMIAAYMIAVLPDDSKHIEVMSVDEINSIRGRSKAATTGPWVTDYEAMAIKTVVKRGLKPFATSPQLQTAIEYDNRAVGLDLASERPPVAMPKAIAATAKVPEADSQPDAQEPESEGTSVANLVVVAFDSVEIKKGTNKRGPWKLYKGRADDGNYYSTFDSRLGETMKAAEGQPLTVKYEQTEKGRNVLDIILGALSAEAQVSKPEQDADDDLPW